MIKEDKVLVKINLRNSTHYKKHGYDISKKELLVNIDELTKSSKSRVTAVCEICSSENSVTYGKYNVNILYRDYEDQPPSKRYIQVYNLSKTKSGNDAIRAYQIFGASKKGNKNKQNSKNSLFLSPSKKHKDSILSPPSPSRSWPGSAAGPRRGP